MQPFASSTRGFRRAKSSGRSPEVHHPDTDRVAGMGERHSKVNLQAERVAAAGIALELVVVAKTSGT